jgi:hypothetical protein
MDVVLRFSRGVVASSRKFRTWDEVLTSVSPIGRRPACRPAPGSDHVPLYWLLPSAALEGRSACPSNSGWHRDKPHFDRVFACRRAPHARSGVESPPTPSGIVLRSRGPAAFDLYDVGAVAGGLGTASLLSRRSAHSRDRPPLRSRRILAAAGASVLVPVARRG